MDYKDFPLGSTFEHNGIWIKVVKDSDKKGCKSCYFSDKPCKILNCTKDFRKDEMEVRFEKIESPDKN